MSKSRPSLILERAARQVLAPLGLSQVGRSRSWRDDHRWYSIIVEFQPSDFSLGSYLNVGINWLWSEIDYETFDVSGDRGIEYVEYESDAQFEPEAERLATFAARQVTRYRARFPTAAHAARHYGVLGRGLTLWDRYHAGVLRGLLGHRWRAGWHFRRFCAETRGSDLDYEIEAGRRVARLRALTVDPPAFRREIRGAIERTRALLGMPAVDGDPLPLDAGG